MNNRIVVESPQIIELQDRLKEAEEILDNFSGISEHWGTCCYSIGDVSCDCGLADIQSDYNKYLVKHNTLNVEGES